VTVLVGILCSDGVVIGSDSAATFGASGMNTIGQQYCQKVTLLQDKIVYASTGAVGIGQLIADMLHKGWAGGQFKGQTTAAEMMGVVAARINHLVVPFLQSANMQRGLTGEGNSSICKSLVAMPVKQRFELFNFDVNGAPEHATQKLPFVALGSGQPIADPFLALLGRLLWPDRSPTLAEGRLAAVWTIDHVRRTTPGGVGGQIQLATLVNATGTAQLVDESEVQEHLQAVTSALDALVTQIRGVSTAAAVTPSPSFP
jgi:hypothetical protein